MADHARRLSKPHRRGVGGKRRSASAADKLHNARRILRDYRVLGDEVWQRFQADKEETLWYYREVTTALIRSGRTRVVDELERVVGEIERLAGWLPASRCPGGSSAALIRWRLHGSVEAR